MFQTLLCLQKTPLSFLLPTHVNRKYNSCIFFHKENDKVGGGIPCPPVAMKRSVLDGCVGLGGCPVV